MGPKAVRLLALLLFFAACSQPQPLPTPLPSPTLEPQATATPLPTAVPTATATPSPTPTATPSPTATPTATPTAAPTTAPSPSGQRAYQHVRYLAETIGSRPTGAAEERAAADYIEAQFRSLGYSVERQGFPVPYFVDRGSRLSILQPSPEDLHPNTLGFSAAGQVEGPLAPVGLGRAQDMPPEGLRGKVALMQRGEITFQEKVANAARAGAAGAIIYNNAPGNFAGRLSQVAPIPAVSLSQQEGKHLEELAATAPLIVRLSVQATSENRRSENIIATRPGASPRTIIFGAHYDSVEAGPGANDNASGVAAVLELARVMAQPGALTLRFIAFGAEEVGLVGSRHYVSTLTPQEREQIVAMASLDMVGVGDRMRFGGRQELVDRLLSIAGELEIQASGLGGSGAGASDHASFLGAGMSAVLFHFTVGVDIDPRYHTAQDQAPFVDPALLERAVRVGLVLASRLEEGR